MIRCGRDADRQRSRSTTAASGADLNPAQHHRHDADRDRPQADLQITKSDGVTSVTPGTLVTYTITITNAGPNAITGAAFTDNVPASLAGVTYTTTVSGGAPSLQEAAAAMPSAAPRSADRRHGDLPSPARSIRTPPGR